jgi:hypothetical protein
MYSQDEAVHTGIRLFHGAWITSSEISPRAQAVLRFRHSLVLARSAEHFNLRISADNQFLLYVNGQEAGRGPSVGDLQHWRYETLDIGRLLHAGENLVAVTVWNGGVDTPVREISDRTGLFVDSDTFDGKALVSDSTWDVAVERGLTFAAAAPEVRKFYYVAVPEERFRGVELIWDWAESKTAHQSQFSKAIEMGRASPRGAVLPQNNWQLVRDTLPEMEMREQLPGRVVRVRGLSSAGQFPAEPLQIPPHSDVSLLLDAGEMTTAFPELVVGGGSGGKLTLTYAEALYDDKGQKGNRNQIEGKHILGLSDHFTLDGAPAREYQPLEWRTWRFLQIDVETGDQAVMLSKLAVKFTAYPFQMKGAFASDDGVLNSIWRVGWRTARVCAHDTYMDTPYWERLQYVGDTRIQALISYSVAGDGRLARQAIDNLHNSVTSDGVTLSRAPSSLFQFIPGFSLYWIAMVHDYWMYQDDSDFVRQQLPLMRSTIDWFSSHQAANLLLANIPSWPFADWSPSFTFGIAPGAATSEGSVIYSLQFVEALRYASELEAALGNNALAQQDRAQADKLSSAVRSLAWDEHIQLLADTPLKDSFSQQANAYGVWLDVIPKEVQQHVMENILSVGDSTFKRNATTLPAIATTSFYYRFYVARALIHAGLGDRYTELLGPWRTMLAQGLTTWAENPEPTRSDSHAWSAHPNFDFLTTIAGVSPSSPGFSEVRIEPHLGPLNDVDAVFPSIRGDIRVNYKRIGSDVHVHIHLPPSLSGKFVWHGTEMPLLPGSTLDRTFPDFSKM